MTVDEIGCGALNRVYSRTTLSAEDKAIADCIKTNVAKLGWTVFLANSAEGLAERCRHNGVPRRRRSKEEAAEILAFAETHSSAEVAQKYAFPTAGAARNFVQCRGGHLKSKTRHFEDEDVEVVLDFARKHKMKETTQKFFAGDAWAARGFVKRHESSFVREQARRMQRFHYHRTEAQTTEILDFASTRTAKEVAIRYFNGDQSNAVRFIKRNGGTFVRVRADYKFTRP